MKEQNRGNLNVTGYSWRVHLAGSELKTTPFASISAYPAPFDHQDLRVVFQSPCALSSRDAKDRHDSLPTRLKWTGMRNSFYSLRILDAPFST
jgi:hypothetical protein